MAIIWKHLFPATFDNDLHIICIACFATRAITANKISYDMLLRLPPTISLIEGMRVH